ncbi:PhoH family protein [Desulfofustis glycolicus]|uniref:PhoH-like protein n=1 Tax=Desulfofustis glycolicus DSM 9705 TaxID=1121409 RepID=A0A1M5YI04_9BACT|nr:PhoH family protein [Desulfofustis glycolicus]MCB2214792.1 PhoH family protein [Desulfobulbaceae bacterium]SHI11665.1 phosphate starvation-inducible protein PhoH [Desulfofustis glycolicus DSM 9705]
MQVQQERRTLELDSNELAGILYGDLNKNLLVLENGAGVKIHIRGASLTVAGARHDVALAVNLLEQLYELIRTGYPVFSSDVAFGLKILQANAKARLDKIFLDKVYVTTRNRVISPKTPNQKIYIDAIRDNDIVFGIGPAGTGKTYLAVAMAVSALVEERVRSIILTRPAVEAGEKLGFLPGDLAQKVDPFLRPLNDALIDMLGPDKASDLVERSVIEIAPLAFMRGRTLSNAFIILDEAQNTTREQMKMFLTRIGFDSRAVVTGDTTQVDLPVHQRSGLIQAESLLQNIPGIGFCRFTKADVVRHPLVQKIIHAYEMHQAGNDTVV